MLSAQNKRGTVTPLLLSTTFICTLLACLAFFVPGLREALCFDRQALAHGEYWRLLSAPLTHITFEHFYRNLSVFVVLGILCELRNPRHFKLCVLGTTVITSIFVWWIEVGFAYWYGLSAINSALFIWLALDVYQGKKMPGSRLANTLSLSLLAIFISKTLAEIVMGHSFFVTELGPNGVSHPASHLIGGGFAAILVLATKNRSKAPRPKRRRVEFLSFG
jgi:rhomboid family GlyGly-CTERM serine protease